jgi:hypothetical protein
MTPRLWKITSLVSDARSATSQAIGLVELWGSMKRMDRFDLLTAARQFREAADWIEQNVSRIESTTTSSTGSLNASGKAEASIPA